MYFKPIPKIYYPFTISGTERYVILKNITVNARFIKDILSNISLYDMYDIREGETPEIIADKFYGSSTYHWIVMLANDRYDNINDWPLSYNDLIKYCQDKYNNFKVKEWTYDADVNLVIATIPNHGISITELPVKASVINAKVNINSNIENSTSVNGDWYITAITKDTVSFSVSNKIIGSPSGGFTILTQAREYLIHHYENAEGYVVNDDWPLATPISYFTYEERINESKRTIKIIDKAIVEQIASEYVSKMTA